MKNKFISLFVLCGILLPFIVFAPATKMRIKKVILASKSISLSDRYRNKYVNDVFKDNILLTLLYMRDKSIKADKISWKQVEEPFRYTLVLRENQIFAFHDDVLPLYKGKISMTTNAHFNYGEGFKSDGYLTGDGVCHLASLIYWVSKSAGLKSYAPTRHDFAVIPGIPAKFGVSIYDYPGISYSNEVQNLYVTNNLKRNVGFVFDYNGQVLKVSIVEL